MPDRPVQSPALREITLHDTRTGEILPLRTREPGKVGIYVCGPTVYGRVHVGNARPFVVFSLLKRFLQHEGYEVTFVANVTDVNDKIYAAAAAAGVASETLAREMTAHYVADTDGLGLGRPDREPLASATIAEIVALIALLIERGHAYAVDGDVYFSVRSYPSYGELSHRRLEDMDQGEGGEGADRKRDPFDFALWKAQKPGEDTAWDARWGRGRPGWHIECSAMAEALLGLDFEIHGGGSDLIFPHHENEAAQTSRRTRRPARPALGPQRHGSSRPREDGQVGRQQLPAARRARRIRARCADRLLLRGPLSPADRVRRRSPRRGFGERRALPRGSAPARGRSVAGLVRARCEISSSPRWPRISTPRARSRRRSIGCARRIAPPSRSETRIYERCSACWRWTTCSTSKPSPLRRRRLALLERRAGRPGGA